MPPTTVRPCAGKAGTTMALARPSACMAASVSAATFPRSVESIFLMQISPAGVHRRSTTARTRAAASRGGKMARAGIDRHHDGAGELVGRAALVLDDDEGRLAARGERPGHVQRAGQVVGDDVYLRRTSAAMQLSHPTPCNRRGAEAARGAREVSRFTAQAASRGSCRELALARATRVLIGSVSGATYLCAPLRLLRLCG